VPAGEEILIKTGDVRVRIIELAPQEVAHWHRHSEVTDNMFCLSGRMSVRVKDPEQEFFLRPGERCTVARERAHQVANANPERATYLLVQGVGKYDFLEIRD
jgi:mannose-6-phosphate isomerase-like protein (cupin superfamily)